MKRCREKMAIYKSGRHLGTDPSLTAWYCTLASRTETVHFRCFSHPGFYTLLWQPLQTRADTKADFSSLAKREMVCETLSIALR